MTWLEDLMGLQGPSRTDKQAVKLWILSKPEADREGYMAGVTTVDDFAVLLQAQSGGSFGGGTGRTLLPRGSALSQFLDSVQAHQDQFLTLTKGVVRLDPGVLFPQTGLDQLFVRDCYVDLLEADAEYRGKDPDLSTTYMTGNPGTGKSCCGAIHMSRCLAERKTVVLEVHTPEPTGRAPRFFRLKLGEPVTTASTSIAFTDELADPTVCYFVDGGLPSADAFKARCWAYTSPRAMSMRALKVVHQFSHTLKMPLFSLDELLVVRQAVEPYPSKMSEAEVCFLYKLAGGSARMVLEWPAFKGFRPEDLEAHLTTKITGLNDGHWQALQAEVGDVGFSSTCETVCQWHILEAEELPGERRSSSPVQQRLRRFKRHRLQFASGFVAALVARHQALSARNMCAKFLLTEHGQAGMGGVVGNQFERLVHATLPQMPEGGVELKLKLLGDKQQEFTLHLPPSAPRVFAAISEAAGIARPDCSLYLMPASRSYPAIDCLMSRKLLLQIASGDSHSINRDGIEEVCRAVTDDAEAFAKAHEELCTMIRTGKRGKGKCNFLEAELPLLVFVTPDYQYQNWTQAQAYTGPQPRQMPVQQAVMCFPSTWAATGFQR